MSWVPKNPTNDRSMLVQVMAWCRQATSHHLSWWQQTISQVELMTLTIQWVKDMTFLITFIFTTPKFYDRKFFSTSAVWIVLDKNTFLRANWAFIVLILPLSRTQRKKDTRIQVLILNLQDSCFQHVSFKHENLVPNGWHFSSHWGYIQSQISYESRHG